MTEKFEIKIVRLRTGEDLIGFYHQDKETNTVIIKYPKTFYPTIDIENETEEIIMVDWMPLEAFPLQEAPIPMDHILFVSYSSIEFGYRYLDAILDYLDPESTLAKQIKETIVAETDIPPEGSSIH
jgi:hypothetical protein